MVHYVPPSPADLLRLAEEFDYSRSKMAELANVSTGRQWAKYTWNERTPEPDRRDLGYDKLFLIAARLELMKGPIRDEEQIHARMRAIGAQVRREPDGAPEQPQPSPV